jgi:hypothetical protein
MRSESEAHAPVLVATGFPRPASDAFQDLLDGLPQEADLTSWPEALQHFAAGSFADAIRALLADPYRLAEVASRSYRHGNGFAKIVLARGRDRALRLHASGGPAEENVHDHRWAFASTILRGSLENVQFRDCEVGGEVLREFRYERADQEADALELGAARVEEVSRRAMESGDAYSMEPGCLHRIVWSGAPTMTLMATERPVAAWNRLLSRVRAPAMARDPLTVEQVSTVLRQAMGDTARLWREEVLS